MIDAIFLFIIKVAVILFCIVVTLAPIYVCIMFIYGFYHDYLRSPNKRKGTRDNISA